MIKNAVERELLKYGIDRNQNNARTEVVQSCSKTNNQLIDDNGQSDVNSSRATHFIVNNGNIDHNRSRKHNYPDPAALAKQKQPGLDTVRASEYKILIGNRTNGTLIDILPTWNKMWNNCRGCRHGSHHCSTETLFCLVVLILRSFSLCCLLVVAKSETVHDNNNWKELGVLNIGWASELLLLNCSSELSWPLTVIELNFDLDLFCVVKRNSIWGLPRSTAVWKVSQTSEPIVRESHWVLIAYFQRQTDLDE